MLRRSFLQTTAAVLCSLGVKKDSPSGYFYNWNCRGLLTSDPRYPNLPYGIQHYRMVLNGEELKLGELWIINCHTGSEGWVEGEVRHTFTDFDGKVHKDCCVFDGFTGEIKTWVRCGKVEMWIDGEKV